ncbi:MinD/ParA family protein [Mycolicibacillus parakoreensis]|uniref:MinD/ParA family protein n=1 Tax=Mycolicibacillus parakoreensis TaxID=1069221 RepID=A0ABY3TYI8_9MYCO|nr:MinD/ParA family protein [Mycolicibacillus parakoreensis]MCV7316545.1 MinD/ParA family protein [Mycolicibacillus parakoreensis]ULN52769.1 MinD/ParA family protein [Mycolicibacillus parakoreensis]
MTTARKVALSSVSGAAGPPPETAVGPLRIADLVAPRKIPPSGGWRRLCYGMSCHRLNPGESRRERHYRELRTRIRRHIRKQFVIGVVSGKGGVGKTTLTAALAGVFRQCRPENVVALDAVPGFGTLAGRIDEHPPGDYAAVLADTEVYGYADIREHLGQNALGLDVLAGDQASDRARPLDSAMYQGALARLRRTHTILVVDTADDFEHPVMAAVLGSLDTLVLVSGLTVDTSAPVARTMELLRAHGHHELVAASTVVLNDSRGGGDPAARRYLAERFTRWGAGVEFLAYDPHLATGGIIDIEHQLRPATRLRLFEIAAGIADKYVPEADRLP